MIPHSSRSASPTKTHICFRLSGHVECADQVILRPGSNCFRSHKSISLIGDAGTLTLDVSNEAENDVYNFNNAGSVSCTGSAQTTSNELKLTVELDGVSTGAREVDDICNNSAPNKNFSLAPCLE